MNLFLSRCILSSFPAYHVIYRNKDLFLPWILPHISFSFTTMPHTTQRKIIHIDMDAFYASVEMRDHPEWKGIPIAVGRNEERGVVATANYEARKYGVHSAMSSLRAKKLCPNLLFVESRIEVYKSVSQQIHHIFHRYTDLIEPLSLDEAFLDVTVNKMNIPLAVEIAKRIKKEIKEELQLTASAGVSYNKFLAKIASDYRKPDGLFTIHPQQAEEFIKNLPIEQFWGIGKATADKMHRLQVFNGEQLLACSKELLVKHFGKNGLLYYDFARGIDLRPVETNRVRKSVGCEHTLEKDLTQPTLIILELYHVTQELIRRIEKSGFQGNGLTLKIKYSDFTQITRSLTHSHPLCQQKEILPLAKKLLKQTESIHKPIRLIGLSVTTTHTPQSDRAIQLSLPFGG